MVERENQTEHKPDGKMSFDDEPMAVIAENSSMIFPSLPTKTIRLSIHGNSKRVTFLAEDRGSKDQWEITIKRVDLGNLGIRDIPADAVLEFFKEVISSSGSTTSKLDVDLSNEGLMLMLQLEISPVWKPKLKILLEPKLLEKADRLASKLRDFEEEVDRLKSVVEEQDKIIATSAESLATLKAISRRVFRANPYLYASPGAVTDPGFVQWTGFRSITGSSFFKMENAQDITINKKGTYQVAIRFTCYTGTAGTPILSLYVNNAVVAEHIESNDTGFFFTVNLFDILPLNKGDVLKVRYNGSSSSAFSATLSTSNKLMITLLDEDMRDKRASDKETVV